MSDTTPDSNHTPHAATAPESLTGLTEAQAAVYTELAALTDPATVAELARAAGVGHSTAGKAVTTLEKRGLASRIPGGHDGPQRTPDLWHLTPDTGNATAPANTEPGPSATDALELTTNDIPVSDSHQVDDHEATVDGTTSAALAAQSVEGKSKTQPHAPTSETDDPHDTAAAEQPGPADTLTAPDVEASNPTTGRQGSDAGQSEPSQKDDHDEASGQPPAPLAVTEPPTSPVGTTATPLSEKRRLAPGALRQMVIDHLQAHPDEAFTATRISRVIEKSSGAIANALATLVGLGIAEQVSDTPRTYRVAEPTPANNSQ
ncbi:helix-turn-helix domain-containing protein [Streptomyces sp. WZ-12]|uniref:helix-turn-helix domain-containing protein n=1 Tax=Streptomyces sp. WZ-12 TaxID=3030210 RepID=UPI002381044F|nr:helix-turn-helix domain-containing protein [Streptomyces sp. WZ-12]